MLATSASESSAGDPLALFVQLGPSVYMHDPKSGTAPNDGQPVILLAFWMDAPARALSKYVVEYTRMVPSARIIFLRSASNDFFFHAAARAQQARLAPAIAALRTSVTPDCPVFMHIFSNGGVFRTTHLLKAYRQATGRPLPISSMVIDSAPGTASITAAMRAFSFAMPRFWILRWLSKSILLMMLAVIKLYQTILRIPNAIKLAREEINDRNLVQPADAEGTLTRCYIYSSTDELVDWRNVERHASDSEACGWTVHREKFQGTPHVGHMRAQPERYWSIIREHLRLKKPRQ
ncbi:Indole-diterpene biosynthesis protein [Penicillium ucsense]|uniref:Indole-diterpene biosynthesis protein n=1 Tax=Penicillium ucsense TaxID=2839758 RepID=A0A8J8W8W7_9EURO|nr:Indole-diterpene biosynthesis protein [Penicillium ucsense]KAF7738454.1 Indole-diterpene biosynthesis protein [Penicillium ucsense]